MKVNLNVKKNLILFLIAGVGIGIVVVLMLKPDQIQSDQYQNPLAPSIDTGCANPSTKFGYGSTDDWVLVSEDNCGWAHKGAMARVVVPFGYRLDSPLGTFCVGTDIPLQDGTLWKLQSWENCVPQSLNVEPATTDIDGIKEVE